MVTTKEVLGKIPKIAASEFFYTLMCDVFVVLGVWDSFQKACQICRIFLGSLDT